MSTQEYDATVRHMISQQISLEKIYEKFTEKARQALAFANDEAALLNHNYIGTEHLLLGLLREGAGLAAIVLRELGVELQAVRAMIEHIVGRGKLEEEQSERRLTPRAQVVVLMALGETWRSSFIGTEHLLLGLVREGEGLAVAILEKLGVSLEQVRLQTFQTIVNQGISVEPLKDIVARTRSNVVTCRIDDQDLSAIDALVEVGIRSTRSDAAAWLIHAGVVANQSVLESVYATVDQIRNLRTKAQALAQEVSRNKLPSSHTPKPEAPGSVEKPDDTTEG